MRPVLRYGLRETRRRPARTLATLLGVVLGIAALTAIGIATRAAREAYREMYASIAGRADLEVVADGGRGFSDAIRGPLARVPGVRAAVPVVLESSVLVAPGPRTPLVVLGVDPALDGAARSLDLVEGKGLDAADGAILVASFARSRGVGVGTTIRLVSPTGAVDLPVVGLAGSRALAAYPGGVALARLSTVQRLFRLEDQVNAVQLVLEPGSDADAVEGAVSALLPSGLLVRRPTARGGVAEATLRSADQGLEAVSLMALVAAVFVIWNAFAMNLAERRRALATLRAIGATRKQVRDALLVEAAALGTIGTVLGIAIGIGGARLLALGIGKMLGIDLPPVGPASGPIALAAFVGPACTIGAAIVPARKAARRHPLHDLLGAPEPAVDGAHRAARRTGYALVLLSLLATIGFVRGIVPASWVAPCVALTMLGAALGFPGALPWLRRATTAVLEPLVGAAGRIGLRHVTRTPGPTTMASTVLFVAAMAGVGMGNEILSSVDDVHDWAQKALVEDFYVRASMPDSGTMFAVPLAERVGTEIGALDDVAFVHRIRFVVATIAGAPAIVIARTFDPARPMPIDFVSTPPSGPPTALGPDETMIGTALARRIGAGPGSEITVAGREGARRLRVVATVTEYTGGGQTAYVGWDTGVSLFGPSGPHAYLVVAKPGRREALGTALRALSERESLLVQSNADLRVAVDGMVGGLVGLLWLALAVVFLVASLGVVNALTTHVLDQTREIGVLRAVAMRRGQVARMVLAEAAAMATMGLVPGAAAGIGLSAMMNAALDSLRGFPIAFHVAVPLVLGCAGVGLAVALVAAVVPARRAARLPVVEALRFD